MLSEPKSRRENLCDQTTSAFVPALTKGPHTGPPFPPRHYSWHRGRKDCRTILMLSTVSVVNAILENADAVALKGFFRILSGDRGMMMWPGEPTNEKLAKRVQELLVSINATSSQDQGVPWHSRTIGLRSRNDMAVRMRASAPCVAQRSAL